MELSIFLAKLLGAYTLITVLVLLVRRKLVIQVIREMIGNRSLIFVIAILELLAGIAIVISHNIWEMSWVGLVTLIGWVMIVEGIGWMIVPAKMSIFGRKLLSDKWYVVMIILSILIGGYLVYGGFGLGDGVGLVSEEGVIEESI